MEGIKTDENDHEKILPFPASADEEIGLTTGKGTTSVHPARTTSLSFQFFVIGIAVLLVFSLLFSLLVFSWSSHPNAKTFPSNENLAPLNFLAVGDWGRKGKFNQSVVAEAMGVIGDKLKINFVISTGDNFYETGLSSLDDELFRISFSDIYTARSLQTLWYTVLGNHDYASDPSVQLDPYLKMRDPRWHCEKRYSIKRSVCFVPSPATCNDEIEIFFIDTSPYIKSYVGSLNFTNMPKRVDRIASDMKWLDASLSSSTCKWKVVVGHHPIRSAGSHGDTKELIQHALPLLEKHHVDLYINGHDHALEYIKRHDSPIPMVTSGAGSKCYRPQYKSKEKGLKFDHNGQGFISVSVSPSSLRVEFYDLFAESLYQFEILKS